MKEHELKPPKGAHKSRKRVGRGNGSGHGTYSGRGGKGQTARSGGKVPEWFEGGQMPLQRRVPKRGFDNHFRTVNQIVDLERIDALDVDEVTVEVMARHGWVDADGGPVKVLAKGTLTRKVVVEADRFSEGARQAILAAGGEVRVRETGGAAAKAEAPAKAAKAKAAKPEARAESAGAAEPAPEPEPAVEAEPEAGEAEDEETE